MRTIFNLPGWFGFIFGPAPSGSQAQKTNTFPAQQWAAVIATPVMWYGRWKQRLDLSELDDYRLRDIGLDRRDVQREVSKPFWHR